MMIFVDRATADEWWRAITNSVAAGYNKFEAMKWISPHFYTFNYNVNGSHITHTLTDDRVAAKLSGRVVPIQLNDQDHPELSMAPVPNYVDHISGNGFFVRSSLQRDQYWFYDGQRIIVSRDYRTRFIISLVSSSQRDRQGSKGQVVIGTDLVSISVSNCNGLVNVQPDLSLSLSQGAEPLVISFSQFDGGFEIGISGVLLSNQQGAGDRWELA
ncbi:hypothetical protein AX14_003733 [Amanita brunnescens Koide BX004]|nr:hypothetical protein AX14_003733 [Amanita brunnescens Koide BX004]